MNDTLTHPDRSQSERATDRIRVRRAAMWMAVVIAILNG